MNGARFPHADALAALPTLCVSQADDQKLEVGRADLQKVERVFPPRFADVRVWLSRCTRADGEPFDRTVTVEVRRYLAEDRAGHWEEYRYDGANPPRVLEVRGEQLGPEAFGLEEVSR